MTDALAISLQAPCWLWTKALVKGYAYGHVGGRMRRMHRYVWEVMRGPIPEGLTIDHLCKVKHCLNPQHMDVVTAGENSLRGDGPPAQNARRTHCVKGHIFDPANTRLVSGHRVCVECQRARGREWYRQSVGYYERHPQ